MYKYLSIPFIHTVFHPSSWEMTRINLDNGYFNNVLFFPDIAAKLLSFYQFNHTVLTKRVTFTQEDVEISKISTSKVVAIGVSYHESRMYTFSHFLTYSS